MSRAEKRNVVVILCDQLRKDFLPAYGCRALATPKLDRQARRGVVFDHAISGPRGPFAAIPPPRTWGSPGKAGIPLNQE